MRGLRQRCPVCGRGKLFRTYFRMHDHCPDSDCQVPFEREPGFYLGSVYVNYGLTALIVSIVYPILLFNGVLDNDRLLAIAMVFVVVFPILFFRTARSMWLAFDELCDPRESSD